MPQDRDDRTREARRLVPTLRAALARTAVLLALPALQACCADAHAQERDSAVPSLPHHSCPGTVPVAVQATRAADAGHACEGAARALAFLARAGLKLPERTTIDIIDRLPGELDGRALGCYVRDTRRVLLLSRAAFDATGGWFGQPPDDELYRSAAAHEVAHAVVGCNTEGRPLPVPAHEYLAYVVMFATMAPPLRERVLTLFGGRGFSSTLQINTIVYIADPLRFAVDAWHHDRARRDGAAWLRAVVAGDVVQEFPTDGP